MFDKLRRKAAIRIRTAREKKTEVFSPSAIAGFRFYQFKASTAAFFHDRLGRTDVRVEDTPHYSFAKALAGGERTEIDSATHYYLDYLKASWGVDADALLRPRVERFRQHFEMYRANEGSGQPVLTRLGTAEDYFVADGNHRTAFAAALGRDIEACIIPADLAFLKYSYMKEFYGTGNKNLPYQSLFLHRTEVIKGRRDDAIRRLEMLPPEVLNGARILDVASNVGMSALLGRSLGARSALGLEISPAMVDIASRFAMFEGVYPQVRFRHFNIDSDMLPSDEKFDVALMFSIYTHLKKPENLLQIARNNVSRYVVFEGHPRGKRENYKDFLDSGLFRSVTEIGVLPESAFRQEPHRILWLCEK